QSGIYAYFITIDSLGNPEFPYIVGSTYYGEIVPGNTPPGGHITISEPVVQYLPTGIENANELLDFNLYQNYPNPFNPETNIKFSIRKSVEVNLKVYDISGKEVATLINQKLSAGSYVMKFNGNLFASGIYYYRLSSKDFKQTKKMTLLK
ncbi:MAG: T9SS type A sorting domain-containing protein, partial [Ignavibacteria bacterium]